MSKPIGASARGRRRVTTQPANRGTLSVKELSEELEKARQNEVTMRNKLRAVSYAIRYVAVRCLLYCVGCGHVFIYFIRLCIKACGKLFNFKQRIRMRYSTRVILQLILILIISSSVSSCQLTSGLKHDKLVPRKSSMLFLFQLSSGLVHLDKLSLHTFN